MHIPQTVSFHIAEQSRTDNMYLTDECFFQHSNNILTLSLPIPIPIHLHNSTHMITYTHQQTFHYHILQYPDLPKIFPMISTLNIFQHPRCRLMILNVYLTIPLWSQLPYNAERGVSLLCLPLFPRSFLNTNAAADTPRRSSLLLFVCSCVCVSCYVMIVCVLPYVAPLLSITPLAPMP